MISRKWIGSLMGCLAAASLLAGNLPGDGAFFPLHKQTPPSITDMVLIYQGGAQRPKWTPDQLAPYVSAVDPRDGTEKWLYDAFLFIEFQNGKGRAFEEGLKITPADKNDWQKLLDKNFEAGGGVPALEQVCAETEMRIGKPLRPRQVVLTLPEPLPGATNWGVLNGRALNFSNVTDRVAASEWHIEQALKKWRELSPKHLVLAGFYYVPEQSGKSEHFLSLIAQKIHERGKFFFWIPYFQAHGSAEWREHGFDAAWFQPNYFFHPNIADSRLKEACDFAREHGMGMEMELDHRMISQPGIFAPRFDAYLNAFEANGVKSSSSMAYYEGGGALLQLFKSKKPEMRRDYDRLAEWVIDRQRIADEALPH